jgi:hypothetical protein
MVKIEKGIGLQNILHFRDKSYSHLRGGSNLLTFGVVCYIFSMLLCSGRLLKKITLSFFLLRLEVIFIGAIIVLVPFAQLIQLNVHERSLI